MVKAETNMSDHTNPIALRADGQRFLYQAAEATVCHLWSWPGHWPVTGHHHQSF